MAILYLQVLKNNQIEMNIYSRLGRKILTDESILYELKDTINMLPKEDKKENLIYRNKSAQNDNFIFYFVPLEKRIFSLISDTIVNNEKDIVGIIKVIDRKIESREEEREIIKIIDNYNYNNNNEEITKEITHARDVCARSLNLILNRGENIDRLGILSEELGQKVKKFQRESKKMLIGSKMADIFLYVGIVVFVFFIYFVFLR